MLTGWGASRRSSARARRRGRCSTSCARSSPRPRRGRGRGRRARGGGGRALRRGAGGADTAGVSEAHRPLGRRRDRGRRGRRHPLVVDEPRRAPRARKGVGVNRIRVEPGARSTPLHAEGAEEEIFFVLAGSGLSWQHDGEREHTYEIRPGDCLVHLAGGDAHSLVAGPDGLDVLAFGDARRRRARRGSRGSRRSASARRSSTSTAAISGTSRAASATPTCPAPEPRPGTIVNVDEVEPESDERGDVALRVARPREQAGSERTGPEPSRRPAREAELPAALPLGRGGDLRRRSTARAVCLLGDEEHPVRAGHVIARPPATRVAHAFRGGGASG